MQTKDALGVNSLRSRMNVYFLFSLGNLYLLPLGGGESSHLFLSGEKKKRERQNCMTTDLIDGYMKGIYFQCNK